MGEILSTRTYHGTETEQRPSAACASVYRVLIKEVNWLGDLVLSLPALRALRAGWAGARISVLIRQELVGFFDGMRWLDEIIPYTLRRGIRGFADQRRIVSRIRQGCFDLAVVFPNGFRAALWASLAGVPQRAGYATAWRRLLLTRSAAPPANALERHQTHYWLGMLRDTLGIPPLNGAARPLEVSPQSVARMSEWLAARRTCRETPLIAIAPAAGYGPAKEWPLAYYARLIDLLGRQAGAECVLLGAPAERLKCERLATAVQGRTIIAAGTNGIAELKALLSLCDGFAGNDSGAMHVAAALGIPAVGIFGSTSPQRTGPVGPKAATIYRPVDCSPCFRRTCRFGHYECLRSIAPEEVVATLAALGALSRNS